VIPLHFITKQTQFSCSTY